MPGAEACDEEVVAIKISAVRAVQMMAVEDLRGEKDIEILDIMVGICGEVEDVSGLPDIGIVHQSQPLVKFGPSDEAFFSLTNRLWMQAAVEMHATLQLRFFLSS